MASDSPGAAEAMLRRAVLLGTEIGGAGAGEGRRRGLRMGVERRAAAAAVHRVVRLARLTVPYFLQRPRRARMASDFLENYIFLTVRRVGSSTELIVQRIEFVQETDKRSHLMDLLYAQRDTGKENLLLSMEIEITSEVQGVLHDAGRGWFQVNFDLLPGVYQAYFLPISQPEGLPLKVQDASGKEWIFQFRFWPNNNSRMYVLEGVTPCIQSIQLQAGDTVTFSRLDPEGKLIRGFRKATNISS